MVGVFLPASVQDNGVDFMFSHSKVFRNLRSSVLHRGEEYVSVILDSIDSA